MNSRDRDRVIDTIIRELRRQSNANSDKRLVVVQADTPDTLHIIGLLDVHQLAEALGGER